jgi:hypothetical protein
VNIVAGDERGVVNVLENHPSLPVMATSGTLWIRQYRYVPGNSSEPSCRK